MKSKIEKLDYVLIEGYDMLKPDRKGDVDYNCLAEKINEIIDYLNSQDQEEENNFVHTVGTPMLEGTTTCSQDTPEEWEERFMDVLETFKDEICSNFFASSKPLTDFIQQLLDDREREVLENMRDWVVEYTLGNYKVRDFDAEIAIGKIIDRELDKLNSKKK